MNPRVLLAIRNAISSPIQAYFPLSELPRNPIIGKDIETTDATKFATAWFADGECYGKFDPDHADAIKNEMCQELEKQLETRNLQAKVVGEVVQEFRWNHQNYDLNNHGVNWLVILRGEILKESGTIFKNEDDHSCQHLNDFLANLS